MIIIYSGGGNNHNIPYVTEILFSTINSTKWHIALRPADGRHTNIWIEFSRAECSKGIPQGSPSADFKGISMGFQWDFNGNGYTNVPHFWCKKPVGSNFIWSKESVSSEMCLASWKTWDITIWLVTDMTDTISGWHSLAVSQQHNCQIKSNPSSTRRWNLTTGCRLVPPKRWAILDLKIRRATIYYPLMH